MRTLWTTVVILGVVSGGTTSALARSHDGQDRPLLPARPIPLAEDAILAPQLSIFDPAQRQAELEKWIADFSAWKTVGGPVGQSPRTWLVQWIPSTPAATRSPDLAVRTVPRIARRHR